MKRRTFLKSAGLAAGGLAASTSLPGFVGGQAKAQDTADAPKVWKNNSGRPNILVIMVDQLRFPQGLFTQEIMDKHAPNLKDLREKSVSFESHYAAAAMCTPSRSTMLTGLYTHQNGIFLTNTPVAQVPDLDPGFPTWGSILNSPDFRYNTYWWGKWHLSSNDATTPDYAQTYGFIDGGLPCPAPNTGLGRGLQGDPLSVEAFNDWLQTYTQSDAASAPWCTTVSLTNPHDIAWYPNCTFGFETDFPDRPLSVRPQPGEDIPLKVTEFDALPPNFEVWPTAGQSPAEGGQGKPKLQELFWAFEDLQAGPMAANPATDEEKLKWYQLLDLYAQVTGFVDDQIGDVLRALKNTQVNNVSLADNTIIVFTADHGEYGGSHGLRNKGFAVYEESIHVPLYVYDPTDTFVPNTQRGTTRSLPNQFTSHVDLLPLLMSLAAGDNAWRGKQQYAHLAGRADLFAMLSDPGAIGREYILSTSDEDYPEFLNFLGGVPQEVIDRLNEIVCDLGVRPPGHVIGYRTSTAKLGVYSFFVDGTIDIVQEGQQAELYDYQSPDGINEVINRSPSGPPSEQNPDLYASMYAALFDPVTGAVATELRQPLPNYLKQVQRRAIESYVAFQQTNQLSCPSIPASAASAEASPEPAETSASQIFMPIVER